MLKREREGAILKELRLRGVVALTPFAERLGVSVITLRRDLRDLESRGLLERVYGGAVPAGGAASTERPGSLPVVGMVVPTTGKYYAAIIDSARAFARVHGVRLVLGVTNYQVDEELRQLAILLRAGVDGLLVTPAHRDFTAERTYEVLTSAPVPVVLLERSVDSGVDRLESVRTDHEAGTEMAVRHLLDLGHRTISLLVDSQQNPTSSRLVQAYQQLMARLDLPEHVVTLVPGSGSVGPELRDRTLVDRALGEIVDHASTAVVLHPDENALTAVQVAAARGIAIPQALSLVSYDDNFAEMSQIPLTSIAPAAAELANSALALCLRRISDNGPAEGLHRLRVVPTLRVRESTGPARVPANVN